MRADRLAWRADPPSPVDAHYRAARDGDASDMAMRKGRYGCARSRFQRVLRRVARAGCDVRCTHAACRAWHVWWRGEGVHGRIAGRWRCCPCASARLGGGCGCCRFRCGRTRRRASCMTVSVGPGGTQLLCSRASACVRAERDLLCSSHRKPFRIRHFIIFR